jgi:hypothetical protein
MVQITILLATVVFVSSQSSAETIVELSVLDQLRTQSATVKIATRIEVYEQGQLKSQSKLDVYVGTDKRSLAVYRSEREAGQKVLMIDNQFWLFLPSSKRAMRITPIQKIMGEASVGDIASLDWEVDYDLVERTIDGDEIKLELKAARKGLSYNKVELWVEPINFHPLRGNFYLKSGKLAKQGIFNLALDEQGAWFMSSLTLQDRVKQDQLTQIFYDSVEPLEMQDKWFTPNFLLRAAP